MWFHSAIALSLLCFTCKLFKSVISTIKTPQPPSHMVILLTLWSSMNPLSSHLKGKHGPLQLQSPKLIAHEIKYMYTSNILTLLRLSNLLSLWLYHYQSDLLRSSFPAYPAGILWYIIKASFDNTLYFSLPLSFIWLSWNPGSHAIVLVTQNKWTLVKTQ